MSDYILVTPEIVEQEMKEFWPISLRELPTFNIMMQEKHLAWSTDSASKTHKKLFNLRGLK